MEEISDMKMIDYELKGKYRVSIAALWALQSMGRLYFYYVYLSGGIGEFLTSPISQGTLQFMMTVFLLLGILGLAAAIGLFLQKKWGYWFTVFVFIATLLFDLWSLTIQSSAVLGFIVPILSLVLFYLGGKTK